MITPDPMTLGSTGLTFSRVANVPSTLSATTTGENVDVSSLNAVTIDGVNLSNLAVNSLVLIKDQYDNDENGIYKKL